MIQVLHIIWSGNFGGIERLVADLAKTQNKNSELRVDILVCKNEGRFLETLKASASRFHVSNLTSAYDICLWKYFKITKIFRQYDVLHFHGFNPFISLVTTFLSQKIVYTEHGNFGFGRKRKSSDRFKDRLKRKYLNSHTDYITFNSQFTQNYAERCYRFEERTKRSVVYNGILFDNNDDDSSDVKLPTKELERLGDKFVVGTSSRFVGFKRIDRLIYAFHEFQKSHDAVLLLVGDGTLRSELENLVDRLHLKSRTIFTGYQSCIRAYQARMDVCVFPSQGEPFGLVAVETLSLGKPTLVYEDGGGITEVIEGIDRLDIVKNNTHLVERLKLYFNSRENITKYSQTRKNYSKRFDIRKMESKFYKIYKTILCVE